MIIMKYVTAGLGGLSLLLAIACTVMWFKIDAHGEKVAGLETQLDMETAKVKSCGVDLKLITDSVDEKNTKIDELKIKAEAGQVAQAEKDKLARELAASRRELAEIAVERDEFEASLVDLPRCEKYLTTLIRLSGGM